MTARSRREAAISTDKTQSWVYAEEFVPEDDVLLRARERASQLGCTPVQPGSGAREVQLLGKHLESA